MDSLELTQNLEKILLIPRCNLFQHLALLLVRLIAHDDFTGSASLRIYCHGTIRFMLEEDAKDVLFADDATCHVHGKHFAIIYLGRTLGVGLDQIKDDIDGGTIEDGSVDREHSP